MKKNMWLDGMMGLAVGDALGVPVQFFSREKIANRPEGPVTDMEAGGVYQMPAGTWSDDTSMALAILDSVRKNGAVVPEDIMSNFVKWIRRGYYTPFGEAFDEGYTCTSAIMNYAKTHNWKTCGRTGEHANGNGALMRNLPLCIHYAEMNERDAVSTDQIVEGIHQITSLTHNHLRAQIASGLQYFMVKQLIRKEGSMIQLLQEGLDEGMRYYGKDMRNLTELAHFGRLFYLDQLKELTEDQIKTSGYVIDTFEAAIWCLITTDSYCDCMLKAVNLGDDADTVAAIAGGMAGLYYGYDAIPGEWLNVLKRREWLENLCSVR